MVVIHFTAMKDAESALARLCDPSAEVSSHYLICERGRVWTLVAEELRAWHAGAGAWGGVQDVNSRSIGIELDNDGVSAFPVAQMDALLVLLDGIRDRWSIPPERVIGHSDCAPGRKVDPGPLFDWGALVKTGHAIEVAPEVADPSGFLRDMAIAGYTATTDEAVLLNALRLRHRQGATGAMEATDLGLARALARRFPVDADATRA